MADNAEPSKPSDAAAEHPAAEDSTNTTDPDLANDATAAVSSLSVQDDRAAADARTAIRVEEVAEETNGDDPADDLPPHEQIRREFLSLLPPAVHPRLSHLKTLHDRREELLERYLAERAALEQKYAELMKPLFEERRAVVAGELDGKIGERNGEDSKEGGEGGETEGGEDVRGIPQFWACAMGNMDVLAELITEEDVDCLEFLTDITCTDFPDGTGFELAFHFSQNPYFTNSVLTKRYEVPNLLTEDEPILKNVTGTPIHWKSGRSLTHAKVQKKQRKKGGRGAGQIRTISKEERKDSFFHFFSPPKMPAAAEIMDEEEADAVEEAFDHDYDVAQALRGCVVPKAVLWFTGEAMEEDYDEGMEGFIAEDEDGDDGEGGDGDGAGGQFQFKFDGGAGSARPAEGENPECKQS